MSLLVVPCSALLFLKLQSLTFCLVFFFSFKDRGYEAGSPGGDHLVPQMDELWTRKPRGLFKECQPGPDPHLQTKKIRLQYFDRCTMEVQHTNATAQLKINR